MKYVLRAFATLYNRIAEYGNEIDLRGMLNTLGNDPNVGLIFMQTMNSPNV